MQSRACRPDAGRRSTVLPWSGRGGCVTRGAIGREKEALAGGGGRTGFFGKREGCRIGKWEGSERLEASKE